MTTTIMTLDPGISGTGYAIWEQGVLSWKLLTAGNIYPSSSVEGYNWVAKALDIESKVKKLKVQYEIPKGAMEFPRYFATSGGEMVAKTGDLLKLTFLCGILYTIFESAELVPVNSWKGQLPKPVVEQRIREMLGSEVTKYKSHTFDAIGIGLYLQGRF